MLMTCCLAKIHNPSVDIRKPYTEIGTPDSFSGRAGYDERYIDDFVREHRLPTNPTTAWLTPAWRNIGAPLTRNVALVGRPKAMYVNVISLLNDVAEGKVSAEDVLAETVRDLLVLREQQRVRMETLLAELGATESEVALSVESIVTLVEQHMRLPRSSRLPVLVVAAAYNVASAYLSERALDLQSHNAADKQTGALGDVEITLLDDNDVLTTYEMKAKRVTRTDIEIARDKVAKYYHDTGKRIENYVVITTEPISQEVQDFAKTLYEETGGIEFVILDCIGFLRHFLHLFHRLRMVWLDDYQQLMLNEPSSAVGQALQEAFVAARRAAESQLAESMGGK
jgi:hypothetical protein